MATESLRDMLFENVAEQFTPYSDFSPEADAINVYFKPGADYSERLNSHITLFRSLEDKSIVGCRIKGVAELRELAPNWLKVDHDNIRLGVIFYSFSGSANSDERAVLKELLDQAGNLPLETCV